MVTISDFELRTSAKDGRTRAINRGKEPVCPDCGKTLEYRDERPRVYKKDAGERKIIFVRRLFCRQCRKLHVELPDFLEKNKQYTV